jgi:hypothetical protein
MTVYRCFVAALNRTWLLVTHWWFRTQIISSPLASNDKTISERWIDKVMAHLRYYNWTQTDKGTYIRTLCQKNEGSVEGEQKPVKMDGRTIYRTLSSEGTPFQTAIDRRPHVWKVPRGRWISHTRPVWLWGYSPFRISSSVPLLHGTKWLLWRPHK